MMAAYLLTASFTWEPEEKVYPQFSNLVSQYATGLADVTKMVKIEPLTKIKNEDGDHTNFGEGCQTTSGASASHAGKKDLQVVKELKRHQCEYCSKVLATRRGLARHTLTHTGERPFECKICGKAFARKDNLRIHMKTHDKDKPFYECGVCHKTLRSSASLAHHYARDHKDTNTHPGEKKFTECGICGPTFSSLASFCLHTSDCRTKDCQRKDQTSSGANESPAGERALQVVKQQKHHVCEVCGKVLKSKHSLARHTLIHTGELPFKCETCGKAFARKDTLKIHMHTHVKKKIIHDCGLCEKTFASLASLSIHLKAVHQTPNKVSSSKTASPQLQNEHTKKCTYCDRVFSTASDLETHMDGHAFSLAAHILKQRRQQFQHERGKVSPVRKLQPHSLEKRTDEDKGQVANTSSISFRTSSLGDSQVDVAVKQYNCRLCGESFAWKSLLAIHMHTHGKENLNKCETYFL